MNKKAFSIRVGAALAAVALAMSVAPAAQAGTDARSTTTGAWGYFGAYGDKLSVKDTNGTDNASARVQLRIDGVIKKTIWASGPGAGTVVANLSIAEGKTVYIRTCRVVKTTGYVHNCDTWRKGTA